MKQIFRILKFVAFSLGLIFFAQHGLALPTINQVVVSGYLATSSTALPSGSYSGTITLNAGGSPVGCANSTNITVTNGYFTQTISCAASTLNAGTGAITADVSITVSGSPVTFTVNAYPVPTALVAAVANSVSSGVITNAMISTSAAIATSKLGQSSAASGDLLSWNGTAWAPSNAPTFGGGATITAGGLTVSAGGATVTGNSTITGTLGVSGTLTTGDTINVGTGTATVQSASGQGLTVTAQGAATTTVGTASQATTMAGNVTVNGTFKAGSTGTALTSVGTCTFTSAVTNTWAAYTCTGIPATVPATAFVHCSPNADSSAAIAVQARAAATLNTIRLRATAAATSIAWTCFWAY